jgi:hypothetical protein
MSNIHQTPDSVTSHSPKPDTDSWQPVVIRGGGIYPSMEQDWLCDPAWDIHAVYENPDGEVAHPEGVLVEGHRDYGKHRYVFRDRHIDRRHTVDYPPTTAGAARMPSATIADPQRAWDVVIEHRDRYLAEAGLSLQSSPAQIAACLAETFRWKSHFRNKSRADLPSNPRELNNPVDGVLYQSACTSCAPAFMAMAESAGLSVRKVGMGAHHVAEVLIDGRWRFIENTGRHESSQELAAFFPVSLLELTLDAGRYVSLMPPGKARDYWKAVNLQYHFFAGRWDSTPTLRLSASNIHALYPYFDQYHVSSDDGRRLPLVLRAGGFYWPIAWSGESPKMNEVRKSRPFEVNQLVPVADFLYHPFSPGQILRTTIWLSDISDMKHLEWTIPLAPESHLDLSHAGIGTDFVIRINDWQSPLSGMIREFPRDLDNRSHWRVVMNVPKEALIPNAVNTLAVLHRGRSAIWAPFIPSAMQPYEPPLGRE